MNIRYLIRQLYGLYIFRKRVYIHGNFAIGNRRNVVIGQRCSINEGVYILGRCKVVIGDGVVLSARCMLLDSGLDFSHPDRPHISSYIEIKENVWIGAGTIVLPGVTIGKGSVIGAGSVVTRSIPEFSLAIGNPAKVVKRLDPITSSN